MDAAAAAACASCALSRRRHGELFLEHHSRLLYLYHQIPPWRPAAGAQCIGSLAPAFQRRRGSLKSGCAPAAAAFHARFVTALRASSAAGVGNSDDRQEKTGSDSAEAHSEPSTEMSKDHKANLRAAGIVSGVTVLGTLAAVSFTLASGGPAALAAAISKSGFFAAFALIFVSEIGDKTFFIAALLAMRHSRALVLLGSTAALSVMTVISVVIGRLFQRVPTQLQTTLPLGEYAAVGLLIIFGLRAIKSAWDLPSVAPGAKDAVTESGELAEAEEYVKQAVDAKQIETPLAVLTESFSLVFLAEWGDRSMLATVALGAAQSPWGVASGAIVGHVLATSLAVLGGAFLAQYISEKVVGYTGGVLFLVFAAATLLGVF